MKSNQQYSSYLLSLTKLLLTTTFLWSTALAFTPSPIAVKIPYRPVRSMAWRQLLRATSTETTSHDETFDQYLQEGNLRQAVNYLRQNPDIQLSRERWNDIFTAIERRTANAEENIGNLRANFPIVSEARQEMTDMYNTLAAQKHLTLYGAVDTKLPLAAGTHQLPPSLLEEILEMPISSLTPKPTNALLFAGVALAILEGIVSIAFNIPLNALVFCTILAALSDRLFFNGAVSETILKWFSPGISEKILRHEAGHLLAAYLLGCPVEGTVLSAWAALQDRRFSMRQVSAGTSFFDPELSRQINQKGQVTRSALDRYSIIVMAGIAAEADHYGQADGGAGDELALVGFLRSLGGAWNADSIKNQARWGALQAVLMLREYKPAYEALVDALERGGTLGDCIYAIEKAARDHSLKPATEPLGYITMGQNGAYWTKEDPSKPNEPSYTATHQDASSQKNLTEEESLAALREYRKSMEEKIKDVERKLSELE